MLNQAVKSNAAPFPPDFMFQLDAPEKDEVGIYVVPVFVQLRQVFETLRELADKVTPVEPPSPPKHSIGFRPREDKPKGSKANRGKKS